MTQYAGSRDPRFVAVHRGGLLDVARHRLLASWAADCAEHVLPLFERKHPQDDRPRKAIEAARAYARGEMRVGAARQASLATGSVVVFDVPLLVESGRWREQVDRVVVVDCSEETQIARVMARSGWTADAVRQVIGQQSGRGERRLQAARPHWHGLCGGAAAAKSQAKN